MADSNVGLAAAVTPDYFVRNRQNGAGAGGKPIVEQYVVPIGVIIDVPYDEEAYTYNGDNTLHTTIYKLAGATVATLTFSYSGGNCTGFVKS